jgi:hypothetical protein
MASAVWTHLQGGSAASAVCCPSHSNHIPFEHGYEKLQ